MRAQAIAFFFSLAQLFGGVVAPALFGVLIATHERAVLALGYYAGGLLMLLGALDAWRIGLDAEGKSLKQLVPLAESPAGLSAPLRGAASPLRPSSFCRGITPNPAVAARPPSTPILLK